ncbi:MAG: tetratricopeptide repeat protein, partial [Bacteroidales bacterium]|nr:tetratricopeptide repeat protein [Bacteroidales bacterium]
MKNTVVYIILLCIILPLSFNGCSTRKNTPINRTYHNITTRFNILFNAKESYKRGIKRAEETKNDDYTQLLSLFLYGDEGVAQSVSGDMGTAAQKASKAINIHSITAKPKVKKSGMSPSDKKFYDKREFNKYMDQCYLLIGKTYVYANDYYFALQTFNFMETEFPEEEILYESRIWKAKALMMEKNYREAARVLTELQDDDKFPDKKALKSELQATIADLYIKQQQYPEAITHVENALVNARGKKTKLRYRYVLAQLYYEQKDYARSSENFKKVIRMNPPYEMSFNATISLASASRGSGEDIREVRKQLNKMLRDSKNADYLDQIYYALAEIEMHEENTDKAIEFYQKSALASTSNLPQKTKSYLTLGNLFYDRRDYVPAQAYYDSAMLNMRPDYPNYIQISSKAASLDALVENLNTIQFQDSVQRIARMPEADRNKLIDNIITELQRKERMQEESEAIRMQQYYSNMSRQRTLTDPTSKAQWYFYNPTTVSQGIGEFQMKWGRRGLEDNWRRKNKGTLTDIHLAGETEGEEDATTGTQKSTDTRSREYYTQHLPLTDSMMHASNQMLLEALYASGYIYNNDFDEPALAAAQYEELIRRYPDSEFVEPSYYYLYLLYSKLNNSAAAEKSKNLLLSRAPESVFAKIIQDPTYLDRLMQEKGEAEKLYEQAYQQFNAGNYEQTISIASAAIDRYPKDVLEARFAYLRAVSEGRIKGTQEAMRNELKKIVDGYPGTEVAAAAQETIDFIDGKDPTMKIEEQVERAKEIYTFNTEGTYYFAWILQSKEDLNQLSFDLLNFNL